MKHSGLCIYLSVYHLCRKLFIKRGYKTSLIDKGFCDLKFYFSPIKRPPYTFVLKSPLPLKVSFERNEETLIIQGPPDKSFTSRC